MNHLTRVMVVSASLVAALLAGELAVRRLDGFTLVSVRLRQSSTTPAEPASQPEERRDRQAALAMPLAPGVDAEWYDSDPTPIPRYPDDPLVMERLQRYPNDPIGALLVWNPLYLKQQICAGNTAGSLGILDDFLVFDPIEDSTFPIYRHLPNNSAPSWFTSNAFGWRGPALALKKPPNTIRIAFVGASTTIGVHGAANSHPEHVGHWLNLWSQARGLPLRFEVINAGRAGIDSASIEAVVRLEVAPVDPDLVIYYEGANQFAPGKLMRMPPALAPRPTTTFRKRSPLEDYLASARRLLTAFDMWTGGNGYEAPKPDYPVVWPGGVDESHPDITQKPLPMDLDAVVGNLDRMRRTLGDGELGVSSFLWMVYPGMQLDLSKHLTLYRYLNDMYWPATYAHLRRTADFQNRVFASYAARYDLPFFDIARDFPPDPLLFADAIHLREEGMRLQAWIYLQQLVPVILTRLDSGRWPRAAAPLPARNPSDYAPRLMSRRDIMSSCRP
ncbi:MAG: SGNH/GDSL hydrolase family protein [Acidobacteriota bacterium]|nr:SGNH/GDSL hydrolase family protein [Acidobacteriota bacterium]